MNIVQGTDEWLNLRKGKITASKIPIIMGISPYQTAYQLWCEELGLEAPRPSTQYMQDGLDAEDAAREFFYNQTGVRVKPDVVFSKENPLFMASLDGINDEKTLILEIKKNNKDYHEMAKNGNVIEFHKCQMQFQMYCTGLPQAHYLSWRKGDEHICIVPRDDIYIERIIEAGLKFKNSIENCEPPELTDRDYIDVSDDAEMSWLATKYDYHRTLWKQSESECESIKAQMVQAAGKRNVKGKGFKISKYAVRGRIDYNAIPELKDIDMEQYRKPAGTSYRITVE